MTVKHMRIDNRLIHGQVTVTWVGSLGADHLLVTNDKVADDPIQKIMLPQAARGVKTSVLSVEATLEYCESDESEDETIMVIAKFASDALRLLRGGLEPEQLNVGNQAPPADGEYTMVTQSIAVTPEAAEDYRKIAAEGYHLTSQMLPSDGKKDFLKLLDNKGL